MLIHQGWFTALYIQHLLDSQSLEFEICIFPREAIPSQYLLNNSRIHTLPLYNCHFYSFYNWETQTSTSNPTPNYQVIAENASGLLFKNKRDRKIINVDPKVEKFAIYFLFKATSQSTYEPPHGNTNNLPR